MPLCSAYRPSEGGRRARLTELHTPPAVLHEHEVPKVRLIGVQPVVLRLMVVVNPTYDFPLDHYARGRVGGARPRPKPPAELFVPCRDYETCVAISRGTEVNYAISDVHELRNRRLPLSKSSLLLVRSGRGPGGPCSGCLTD